MRQPTIARFVMTAAFLGVATAGSAQVHVPADYSTIQAAINSGAAIIYVSQGTYPEVLSIHRNLTLLPEPPADPRFFIPFPIVNGMSIVHNGVDIATVYVRGFHFTGAVSATTAMTNTGITTIEGCRLDGGFQTLGGNPLDETIKIRSCMIFGNATVIVYNTDVTGNTVIGGTLEVHSNGGTGAVIRDNLVLGAPGVGILCSSGDTGGTITGNSVRGAATGYSLLLGTVSGNVAQDCSGDGYLMTDSFGAIASFTNDVARRCGGNGINAKSHGTCTITGCSIDTVGLAGIYVGIALSATVSANAVRSSGGHGIWIEGTAGPTENVVLRAGGDGIHSTGRADNNVTGRCMGNGILAPEARHNTSYLNHLAGYSINGAGPETMSHNIGYGNSGYGLVWTGSGTPTLQCNDWYVNTAGATSGVAVGGSDRALNPLFCNLPQDVVTLSATSPLLAAAGCGLIGALSSGCAVAVDVAPAMGGGDNGLRARPNPADGVVELAWSQPAESSRLDVFDVNGALRYHDELLAGSLGYRWRAATTNGQALPGGVYFIRRTTRLGQETTRIVLKR